MSDIPRAALPDVQRLRLTADAGLPTKLSPETLTALCDALEERDRLRAALDEIDPLLGPGTSPGRLNKARDILRRAVRDGN